MNTVELESHRWKIVLGVAAALASGLGIVSMTADLPNLSVSTAFGGSAPVQPLQPTDCASIAPEGHAWHGVDVDLRRGERTSARVGSARLTVEPPARPDLDLKWHSDLGIDALIVQAPAQSRVHRFDRERFDGAHASFDDDKVERVTLCYDLELTVNTDANPSFTRSYQWRIDENVEPAHWRLQSGDSGVSIYQISVTKGEGIEQGWRVSGTITIDNFTPSDVELESVGTSVDGAITSEVNCGVDLDGYRLASGESLSCHYQSALPDASRRTVTAQVSTNGRVRGAKATSRIDFSRADVHEVAQSVYVTDNQGRTWTFHDSGTSIYERTFHCDEDAGLHPSAVRIGGTDQRSSTSVSVDCQPDESQPAASRP
jgi:hypothetical protein